MMIALQWQPLDSWIVIIGVLCAVACTLPGTFMVLRRMSMMGDAISHAVLPGIAIAFLLTGERDATTIFIGAVIAGIVTTVLTQVLHQTARIDPGASMGVVFTTLFALGLVLIVQAADHVDLDPACVLYGSIEIAPLYSSYIPAGGVETAWPGMVEVFDRTRPLDAPTMYAWDVPRAAIVLTVVLLLNAVIIAVFYKELKISSFDPALATTLGINATLMHHLLMTMVAITTVAAFEVVGSILVVAMLVVPAATAHLLTDRLPTMIVVAVIVAALSAVLGHIGALEIPPLLGFDHDTNTAGMIAVFAGVLFTLAIFLSPRHGILSRTVRRTLLTVRILREDLLGILYRLEEIPHDHRPVATMTLLREAAQSGALSTRIALTDLRRRDHARLRDGGLTLTEAGRAEARRLVRSHRMWEVYIHQHFDLPLDHLHGPAHRLEHLRDADMHERLTQEAGQPDVDPHGSTVPGDHPED